jgi:UDP-2,3-diacylglucosamine pyrophosphatase LpxH
MSKILIIGDLHIKVSDEEIMEKYFASLILNKDIGMVVILGDTLHDHGVAKILALNIAIRFIQQISINAPITYILIGNHDYINNQQFNSTHHWLHSVQYIPNVVVVQTPISTLFHNKLIAFNSYVPDGKLVESLDLNIKDWKSANYIFAHSSINNAKMGAIVVDNADDWKEDYPMLICGHIHNKQTVGENAIYVGVPIQRSYVDSCYTHTLDVITGKWEVFELSPIKKKIVHVSYDKFIAMKPKELSVWKNDGTTSWKVVIDTNNTNENKIAYGSKLAATCITNGIKIQCNVKEINNTNEQTQDQSNSTNKNTITFNSILDDIVSASKDKFIKKLHNELKL